MDGGDWAWMTVMMITFVVAIAAAVHVAVELANRPPAITVNHESVAHPRTGACVPH